MKIVQINATYGDGSTGTIVRDIQSCSNYYGIDAYVAYSSSHISADKILNGIKIGNYLDVKFHALFSRLRGQQGYFSTLATLLFLRRLDDIQPDIIHLHNLHSNYINLNMLLRYIAKHNISTVVTLHDCWFFTGGCFHYTSVGCNRWLENCGKCPKRFSDTPSYFCDKSKKILNDRKKFFSAIKNLTVVGVSRWITGEAVRTVFSKAKSMTIYNGVDLNIFKPTESDFRERHGITDKYVILGPASKWLDPINKDMLEAIKNYLDEKTVMVLFGCGATTPALPKNIIPIGFTRDKHDLAKLYSMADVFINVTREDSLPTINLEAQACGTPVITHNVTGAGETVSDESGIKINVGDSDAMIAAIKRMRNKGKAELQSNLLQRAADLFDIHKNYQQYINLYNNIISDK